MNKREMLLQLERIRFESGKDGDQNPIPQMSLSGALLTLADINHDKEFQLCHDVATRLLERVPEPDDTDLDSE